ATAAIAAAVTTLVAVAIATTIAVVAATRFLLARPGLRGQGRFTGAEEAEDAVPQADALGLGVHRCDRRRGGDFFLARFAHRSGLRRTHVGHRGGGRHVEVGLGQRDGRQLARAAALVAGLAGLFAELVGAQAR